MITMQAGADVTAASCSVPFRRRDFQISMSAAGVYVLPQRPSLNVTGGMVLRIFSCSCANSRTISISLVAPACRS